jgi:porin
VRPIVVVAAAWCAMRPAAADPSSEANKPGEYPEHRFRSAFPSKAEPDFEDKYLFGDWWGARSRLAVWGIAVDILVIADPFVNTIGGKQRGFADYNLVGTDATLVSEPLLGFGGGELHVGFAANYGRSLSADFVGNNFPVQLADVADPHVRLTYLALTQALADGAISFRAGRLTINSVYGEEFLASHYFKAFASVGIDLVPLGLFLEAPGAFGYPDTTWGARVKVEPVSWFYVMAGAYNGDPDLKQGSQHGVDFSIHGPLFVIGELAVRSNYGKHSAGLASNLKLGAYDDGGRWGLYAVSDQEIVRFGEASADRHLGAFAAITGTPDGSASLLPLFVDAGLVLYGPVASRAKDFIGLAVVYGRYRDAVMPPRGFEMALEATYGIALLPGLLLQPDLQYLVRPGGDAAIGNALAVGLNVVITP